MSAGQPSFPTPEFASLAAMDSIRAGRTGYPPTRGIPELRSAVAEYLVETTAAGAVDPGRVLVSAGVKQALFNCAFCLFGPGDEVLVPTPCWPTYVPLIRLTGATAVPVRTRWAEGFQLTPEALEEARTPRTRGLFLNSPGNPTGTAYGADALVRLLKWSDRHGVWVLSDEIYRRLYYNGDTAPSVLDVPDRPQRTVWLGGVSKTFSMTGWRIGFAVGPQALIDRATDLQSQTTSGAAAPSQYAAAAAYRPSERRERLVLEYRDRLAAKADVGAEALSGASGLEVRRPEGGIFLFAKLEEPGDSAAVAEGLLREAGVACVPGDAFGSPGFLRFNFALDDAVLAEGLQRTVAYLARTSP